MRENIPSITDKQEDLVSVIMPAYNASAYIAEAISSVIQQSHHNLELIIINDGSDDDTKKIIFSYPDKRIVYLENSINKGLVYTLNKGLQNASGTYICRFDADDICHKDRIAMQLRFYLQGKADIIGSNIIKTGSATGNVKYPAHPALIKISMLFGNPIVHPSVFFHRRLIDEGSFVYEEEWKHVEDYALWVKLMDSCTFANVKKPLLYYRITDTSVCANNYEEQQHKSDALRCRVMQKVMPGYECNDVERRWLRNSNNVQEEELEQVVDFIIKLTEANKQISYFNEPLFSETLAKRYWSSCLVTNRISQAALRSYFSLINSLSVKIQMRPALKLFTKGFVNEMK